MENEMDPDFALVLEDVGIWEQRGVELCRFLVKLKYWIENKTGEAIDLEVYVQNGGQAVPCENLWKMANIVKSLGLFRNEQEQLLHELKITSGWGTSEDGMGTIQKRSSWPNLFVSH